MSTEQIEELDKVTFDLHRACRFLRVLDQGDPEDLAGVWSEIHLFLEGFR